MAGLIVSATYIHNCDHSGPISTIERVADGGIVLKGNRIVMPACLHAETLAKLHESHQGIEKMRLRARSCMFWNGINRDIEVVVRKCATYQWVQRAQPREPLIPHETPSLSSNACYWSYVYYVLMFI